MWFLGQTDPSNSSNLTTTTTTTKSQSPRNLQGKVIVIIYQAISAIHLHDLGVFFCSLRRARGFFKEEEKEDPKKGLKIDIYVCKKTYRTSKKNMYDNNIHHLCNVTWD